MAAIKNDIDIILQAYTPRVAPDLWATIGVPTNQPVVGSITASAQSQAGLVNLTITWTYTQGALPADSFVIYGLEGAVDPTTASPILATVSGSALSYILVGIPSDKSYRIGIVASRLCSIGLQQGVIVNSWTRTGVDNNLSNFTTAGAPNGAAPILGSITNTTATAAGLTDITVNWSYTDGTLKAENFILYAEAGTTIPTTASLANVVVNGDQRSYTWLGIPYENSYKVGIASSRTYTGGIQTSAITTAWTRTGGVNNLTNFTSAGAPTNQATITVTTMAATAQSATGTVDLTVSWNYTQGAVTADTFLIYADQGTTAPTTSSPLVATVNGDLRSYTFFGVPVDINYKAGIVATRTSAAGVSYPKTIVTGWTRTGVAATITGSVATAATTATWAGVTGAGKAADNATVNTGAFATLSGTLTAANYATYLSVGAVSGMGFAQNQTVSATASGSTLATSLSFNSDGKNVVVIMGGYLQSGVGLTTGNASMLMTLTVGGVTKFNITTAILANTTGGQSVFVSPPILIAAPGAGSVAYALTLTLTSSGGSAVVSWPTLQIVGLKA